MFPQSMIIKKQDLLTVTEDTTIGEVYDSSKIPKKGLTSEQFQSWMPLVTFSAETFIGNTFMNLSPTRGT